MRRATAVWLLLAVSAVVAGCSTRVSPSPPSPTSAPASPTPQTPTIPTTSPSDAEPSDPPGPVDLLRAATEVDGTTSYRLTSRVREGRTEDAYTAVVVNGTPESVDGQLETTSGPQRIVAIGERGWLARDGGPFEFAPAADLRAIHRSFTMAALAAPLAGRPASALAFVGVEARNGVPARHFAAPAGALEAVGVAAPDASFDVWIDEQGRLIALEAVGVEGPDRVVSADIENIDDASNVVVPPG